MKRIVSLLLLAVMLAVTLASCGTSGFDYKTADLAPYVEKLADYENARLKAVIADLADTVTDDDVNERIDELLEEAKAYLKKVEEGSVTWGDIVGLQYKGVLVSEIEALYPGHADGSGLTHEQIAALSGFEGGSTSSVTEITLNPADTNYIDGFFDGIVGLSIGAAGKYSPVKVTFPESYKETSLAGKEAVFFFSIEYKYALVAERELAFGDKVAMKYEVKLADEYQAYKEYYDGETKEVQLGIYTLSQDSLLHAIVRNGFNALEAGSRFGVEFTYTEDEHVDIPNEDGNGNDEIPVKVDYTVTVYSIATPLYFTHAEAESGDLAFKDFLDHLDLKEEDYKDKTYADYKTELTDDMQKERTMQVKADKYQAAFNAFVKASSVNMEDAKMKELVAAYVKEVNDNIEYLTTYYKASGYASIYEYLAASNGLTDLKEYVMYNEYGYKYSTIEKQLQTDAETYVAEHVLFWYLVDVKDITLTDAEYEAGVKDYADLYEDEDFMTKNNITEEQMREALLWDKVAAELVKYTDFETKPVKEA